MLDLDAALEVGITAARDAASLLEAAFERRKREGTAILSIRTKSSPRDLVTDVDREVQQSIVDRIRADFPSHRFIGEEEGAEDIGDPKSPYAWVIDPLDGTMNFVHGKTSFGTMIALLEGRKILLGVIALPLSGELFEGRKGGGARWNGNPIQLRATAGMDDAILCTNPERRLRPCIGGALHLSLPLCGSLHNYGCAADELGEILRGRNDGIFYEGVGLWDIAAGCLLVEEAGGRARWEYVDPGNPRAGVHCVATTEKIFTDVEKFIFAP